MKIFSTFLFVLSGCIAIAQSTKFDVKFSEPMAVFVFVQNLSANYPDNPYKELFINSKYHQEKYIHLIAEYDTLTIDYSYEFSEFPYGQKFPGTTEALIKRNLIKSNSFDEFKLSSVGIIPNTDLIKLTSILNEFKPVYQELVYQPGKENFEKQLKEISDFITTKNIAPFFDLGQKFYNSSWDNSIPFEIVFYPLPNSKSFTAEAFCNNAASAIPSGFKDYDLLISIMLHEIFHILYNEQSLSVKNDLEQWFTTSSSKHSTYAYLLLNEALATAFGNGYIYEQLTGKEDSSEWYNFKYINLMAKNIYPLVKDYISSHKAIDKSFVDNYIKIYDTNLAEWFSEPDNLLTYRSVITNNPDDFNFINQFFPYRSMSQYEDNISENSIDKMLATPITKIVLISKDHNEKLQLIKQKFIELKNWNPDYKIDFIYSVFLHDKTFLIIINSINQKISKQIEELANTDNIKK